MHSSQRQRGDMHGQLREELCRSALLGDLRAFAHKRQVRGYVLDADLRRCSGGLRMWRPYQRRVDWPELRLLAHDNLISSQRDHRGGTVGLVGNQDAEV